jgi:competence protein ComEC
VTGPPAGTASWARAVTDVRLATGAGVAWLGLALCSGRSVALALAVALACLLVGVAGAVLARRGVRGAAGVAFAALCLALVLVPFAGRLAHARASPLLGLARERAAVTLELTVHADPRRLAAKGVAGAPRVGVDTGASAVVLGGAAHAVSGAVFVLAPAAGWQDLLPGQRVRAEGTLQPSLDGEASTTLSTYSAPELIARPPWWQRAAGAVRADLRRSCTGLPESVRGLLPGLVDGDVSRLDPVLAERFRIAGLTHLTAVSGTNCSILVGAVLLVLTRVGARRWVCAVVGSAMVVAFVLVARPSPSVLRSAVMAVIALAALAGGRPKQAVPALGAAVLGLLLWDPGLARNAGFVMSVLATAAIVLIAPRWAEALRRWHVPRGLAEPVAVAAAAHLVTAPVIAAISGRVSLVAIPANVLAEPVVAPATVLGFLAAVLAPLSLALGASVAWLAGWPTRWLVWVGEWFGGLHGAALPWPGGVGGGLTLLGALAGLVLLARRAGARRVLAAGAAAALLVQIPVRSVASGWPPSGWLFVACDVGQGDALVLNAGAHSAVEIDAGPDPVPIDRCLRDLGVTAIPLLVFTHYHLDHVGGVAGALHDRRVGQVIAGPLLEPASGVRLVTAALAPRGVPVTSPPPGTSYDVGAVHLDVLGPSAPMHGTRSDPNNSSLVLRATVGGVRILLTGDAEIEEQQALLDSGADLRADVLKVPHHGSAYSDERFLAAVHAKVAVISVGAGNDYGQPSPHLLSVLAGLGIPVRRTDQDGDVAVCGAPGRLSVVVHGVRASADV